VHPNTLKYLILQYFQKLKYSLNTSKILNAKQGLNHVVPTSISSFQFHREHDTREDDHIANQKVQVPLPAKHVTITSGNHFMITLSWTKDFAKHLSSGTYANSHISIMFSPGLSVF
jgi:hypothetical protein